MGNTMPDQLYDYANKAMARENIPGLSIAVWHNRKLAPAASGLLNVDTGVVAIADSVFQIGLITRVLKASLVMQLFEIGKIEFTASTGSRN